jgi:acyl-CoA synthetase (NDP forming)
VSNDVLVTSGAEAARAAEAIGLPVVMKLSSPDLLHKSDLGLVRVGLATTREVRATYRELVERAQEAAPDAEIEGVLVSEMVEGGVEAVVGVAHDDLFGPTVMVGLGGIFVEVLRDVSFRVPPFDKEEARRMVEELRAYPLLSGARGRRAVDVKALVNVIMKVQRLAVDLSGEIVELDINPLVLRPKGAVALDALVSCR